MVRTFERGLSSPTGFVLPIQRWNALPGRSWLSERWPLRRGKLFLAPGDSPVGLRLPMNSLPWIPQSAYPFIHPQDPLEERGELFDAAHFQAIVQGETARPSDKVMGQSLEEESVRTAMTVEPRDGALCVFMPPVPKLEDYLELLAAVEATARELGLPIHVEGYPPPRDPRFLARSGR